MWQAVSAFAAGGEEALQMSGGQAATPVAGASQAVAGAVHSPAQPSPLFQTSGSRSPALRRGCLELDHVFRPSRGPKIKWSCTQASTWHG